MGFIITILAILSVVGVLAWSIKLKRDSSGEIAGVRVIPGRIIAAVVLIIVIIGIASSVGAIPAGNRGVVLQLGKVTDRILGEGFYIIIPFVQSVERISVRVQIYEASASSASKDLQDVTTQVTLNYYLDEEYVQSIFQRLGREWERKIIDPAIEEAVKSSTAQFNAEKLITERPIVKEEIQKYLERRLKEHNLIVDAIQITDFKFSTKFNNAIEAKVTAEQEALQAKNELERVRMEAAQKVEQAKAEAEALRIQKEQVTPNLIRLREIEVQRIAMERWNGQLPTVVSSGDGSPMVPVLEIIQKQGNR